MRPTMVPEAGSSFVNVDTDWESVPRFALGNAIMGIIAWIL